MRICLSLKCCWLVHCLEERVSKAWSNLERTLSQEVCNRAEELQMLPPFPHVLCLHTSAVPVLCSQPTHPETLLVMEVCTELVQSRLCFWWQYPLLLCRSQRWRVYPCLYSTGTSFSIHRNQKWQIFCILFQFSVEGLHHMNFLRFLKR